jgi:uncharacterized membrane protein
MAWQILALVSALFEGASIGFERKGLLKEHALEYTSSMLLLAMLFTTPFWLFSRPHLIPLSIIGWVIASSLSLSLGVLFIAKSLRHAQASYTNSFFSLAPIAVAAMAVFFLGERLNTLQLAGILLVTIGSYALYSHSHHNIFEPLKKSWMLPQLRHAIFGVLLLATAAVLDKKIVGPEHLSLGIVPYTAMLFFFSGIILLLLMLIFHDGFNGIGRGLRGNTTNLAIVAAFTALSKVAVLLAYSIPGALVSVVYSIKELSLILALYVSGSLRNKDFTIRKASAILAMAAGSILLLM